MKKIMSKKFNSYLGKAGHLYAMSEFLLRGWNVAIPEVDTGDDIYVVEDGEGNMRRVQVKTATLNKDNITSSFSLNRLQLHKPEIKPSLHYLFVIRNNIASQWLPLLVIEKDELLSVYNKRKIKAKKAKTKESKTITIQIKYKKSTFYCYNISLDEFKENFKSFPLIKH